ncbi:MAG: hypothetical protein ACYS99_10705 [Planctomycetota bacterium]|jgi:tetratricopeptide (TPR) repeat protein
MSTECGRDEHCQEPERPERAAAPRREKVSSEGNPFKVASAVLLVLALVLPAAFAIRESRRNIAWEEKLEAARAEVAAVTGLVEEGNLEEAVVALHDIGMKLGPIEGAEEAAFALSEAVAETVREAEDERRQADRRKRIAAVSLSALAAVLEGDPRRAAELLEPVAQEDPLAGALSTLARRLVRLDRAAVAEGEARAAALEVLAREWPLPAVTAARQEAQRQVDVSREITQGITTSRAAVARGDAAEARAGLRRALVAGGLGAADNLLVGIRRRERLSRADQLAAEGKTLPAAALYRTVAIEGGDPVVVRKAVELEKRLARERLVMSLETMADRAARSGDHAVASVMYETSAWLAPGENAEDRARRAKGRWLRAMAQGYRELGELETARVHAREAATLGDVPASRLVEDVEKALGRREVLTRVERAEAALRAGAARYAAALIEGAAVPGDVRRRVEEGVRREAAWRARAHLDQGDGTGALAVLAAAGLRYADAAGPLVGRALLLTGEVDAGLSRLPREAESRVRALRGVALGVAASEPVRAAALLERSLEIAGPRADLLADVALALERAGDPEKAKGAWEQLRNAALAKAPLPEEGTDGKAEER